MKKEEEKKDRDRDRPGPGPGRGPGPGLNLFKIFGFVFGKGISNLLGVAAPTTDGGNFFFF